MNYQQKYIGSLASALDHFFGGVVLIADAYSVSGIIPDYLEDERNRAVGLLEKVIMDKNISEYKGVTRESVGDLLEIARGNLRDFNILKQAYVKYFEIIGKDPSRRVLYALNQGIETT